MIRVQVWAEVDGEECGGKVIELVEGQPITVKLDSRMHRVLVVLEPETFETKEVER